MLHDPDGWDMPKELYVPLQMQALELPITQLWAFLGVPTRFIDQWVLVRGVLHDYHESLRESG